MTGKKSKQTQIPRLISVTDLAKMLSLSPRTVFRLRASEKLPPPVFVGGSVRWKFTDIELFLLCNCNMSEFKARKEVEEW